MNQQRIVGFLLLFAGVILLIHQLGWVDLSGRHFIGALSILVGLSFYRKAMAHPQHQGVFGGTFFVTFGLALMFFDVTMGLYHRALLVGLLFSSLALANLSAFVFSNWQRNVNLFLFFFFGAIGGSILMVYFNVLDVWEFEAFASRYWPVIFIVLGFMILIDSVWQKRKRLASDEDSARPTPPQEAEESASK